MPELIRLYIRQVVIGFVIAAAFVGLLLWFNVANLWHLVTHSDIGMMAVIVLWVLNGIVFAGVQFGIAVMRMAEPSSGGGGTRSPQITGEVERVPVAAAGRKRPIQVARPNT